MMDGKGMRIPISEHGVERYVITIQGENAKGKTRTGEYDVTKEEYEQLQVGDLYQRDGKFHG